MANCTPDPYGVCQHTCTADPGPALVDCDTPESSYTFSGEVPPISGDVPPIWTFEEDVLMDPDEPLARAMYSYTDNSTVIASFTIKDSNDPTGRNRVPKTWQPRTAPIQRCLDPKALPQIKPKDPNNRAIHIQGGPFLSWGGGVGIGLKNFPSVGGTVATPDLAWKDVSNFEGISFWARRGPDSQVGFRVLVGDKYTDDDISYLMYRNDPTMPRYCERVRECGCLNHRSCVSVHLDRAAAGTGAIQNDLIPSGCQLPPSRLLDTQEMKFCGTPELLVGASTSSNQPSCDTCEETRCNERYPAYPDDSATLGGNMMAGIPQGTDLQFFGKPCSPYTMRNGIFGYWCFDPAAGERPAETTEQCGDHWTHVVNLSNEWQFYTVPFNQMEQQGWAKRSAALDLTSVSVIRFTWDGGWIDYWIDDVRFYRHAPPQQPTMP